MAAEGRASGVLWRADMEEGSLADWYHPSSGATGNYGGGEYNSGSADSDATTGRAHSGSYAVQATVAGSGGTRLFRWREPRLHRELVFDAWLYFPRAFRVTGADRLWDVLQWKSRSTSGEVVPIWFINIQSGSRGTLTPDLIWSSRTLAGPQRGQRGFRRLRPLRRTRIPTDRWVHFKAFMRQSKDFDGVLRIWQDGRLIFDQRRIRTSLANCEFNSWCAANEWSVNNYSSGLLPSPASIYVDDARIRRPCAASRSCR